MADKALDTLTATTTLTSTDLFYVLDGSNSRKITWDNVNVQLGAYTLTLTNKTIDLGSNTLTGSAAEFDTALQSDTFVFTSEVGSVVQAHSAVLDATTASFTTADETKLDGIEASADVTDEANVVSALDGATLTDLGTPASGDKILLQDASDSDNLKVALFSEFGGGGSGTVDTSGTPSANDFARFTDADTIEGRSYSEVRGDLSITPVITATSTSANEGEHVVCDNGASAITITIASGADFVEVSRDAGSTGTVTVISADDPTVSINGVTGGVDIDAAVGPHTFVLNSSDYVMVVPTATLSHNHAASDITSGTFANARVAESNVTQHEAAIDHDALTNFAADEHIAHSGVTLTAGEGLSGGGTIAASRSFALDVNGLTAEASPDGAADYVPVYDASAGAHRKMLLNNLPSGGGGSSFLSLDGAFPPEEAFSAEDSCRLFRPLNNSLTTEAIVADRLYLYPGTILEDITLDKLAVEVTTAAAASSNMIIGIYNADRSSLLVESGEIACDATGLAEDTGLSTSISAQNCWVALISDGAPTFRAQANTNFFSWLIYSVGSGGGKVPMFLYRSLTYPGGSGLNADESGSSWTVGSAGGDYIPVLRYGD